MPARGVRGLRLALRNLGARLSCCGQHDDLASRAVLERALDVGDAVQRPLEGEEQLVVSGITRIRLDVREEARERRLRVLGGHPIAVGRIRHLECLEGIERVVPVDVVAAARRLI